MAQRYLSGATSRGYLLEEQVDGRVEVGGLCAERLQALQEGEARGHLGVRVAVIRLARWRLSVRVLKTTLRGPQQVKMSFEPIFCPP